MILAFEQGRLGNQIFQYAALRTLADEGEKLCLVGFSDLQGVFDGVDAIFLSGESARAVRSVVRKVMPKACSLAARFRLVGEIGEERSVEGLKVLSSRGLLGQFRYCQPAYFQSESAFRDEAISSLSLKIELRDRAKQTVRELGRGGRSLIFVQVRRTDYLSWPSRAHPAILPASWYRRCMELMRETHDDPVFVVLSDDQPYCRDVFSDLKDVSYSAGSAADDFALMAECDGGILSASSFSWWGAYHAAKRRTGFRFLAPLHWGGHSMGSWHPPGIQTTFIEYVPAHLGKGE